MQSMQRAGPRLMTPLGHPAQETGVSCPGYKLARGRDIVRMLLNLRSRAGDAHDTAATGSRARQCRGLAPYRPGTEAVGAGGRVREHHLVGCSPRIPRDLLCARMGSCRWSYELLDKSQRCLSPRRYAKALGLTVPPSIRLRADEVIE
jgi:hypothetical protein